MKNKIIVFLLLLLLSFSQQVLCQSKKQKNIKKQNLVEQAKKDSIYNANLKGFPVAPFKDTLFYIYHRVGSFSAENRANLISEKIRFLYNDDFFISDSIKIMPSELGNDIIYKGDNIIMSVLNVDTIQQKMTVKEMSEQNLKLISKAVNEEKIKYSTPNLLKRIGLTFLVVFFIFLVLYLVNKGFVSATNTLVDKNPGFFKGFRIKNVEILSPLKQEILARRIVTVIKWILSFMIIYFSLPIMFSFFPSTEAYADTLLNWVFTPAKSVFMGFVSFLPNLFSIIVIVVIFRYAIKILKFFVDEIKRGNIHIDGFYSDWALPTFNIVRVLLYAFMVVIIFPYLPGSDSPIFQGVSVFIGILFSLGSSNAIANMVAGLVITYMRPFKIGDFIKIGDVSGEVIEKTALVTRVRTTKFEDVTIPNATVLSSTSTNYSANTQNNIGGLVIHTTITIGYDVPWKDVHKALIAAANRTDFVQKLPEPFVLQTSLDDFYVAYQINAYTREPNKQPRIYSSLHQNIQDCFNEAGIEIMSPHYRATRDGSQITIPPNYS
ncbi:mechanosensitive ion channel family protein [Flavobacterium agrisoli]|uniref:Mechanosensitive ion channel family protein n=1 Tax=Flavobacterium agrisoli TaxID=2793066 RepID=A0A934PP06_9FLAO|nr:mechanosensitive ion channel family protein [Flavobacterium agrisoli]MBK0369996.1 mechanosensitive ion channel family protein [Flavobacterium agrisoli]